MQFYIDVVGACNLSCPSCPVGSLDHIDRPKGVMSRDLFNKIIEKIYKTYTEQPITICLFNWGEPLLHPQLPLLIEEVRRRGWHCIISSNMNNKVDLGPIVASGPTSWRISLSGASQAIYGRTHKNGRIEYVLKAMRALRRQMDIHQQAMDVEVFYHLYQNNLKEELARIHRLAGELDFRFTVFPAHMMPIENYLHLKNGNLSENASSLLNEYLINPKDLVALTSDFSHDMTCELLSHTISICHDGSVDLCCGTYEQEQKIVKDFCSLKQDDLQARRNSADICKQCKKLGIHKLYDALAPSNPALEKLLVPRLKQLDPSGLAATLLGFGE